MLSMPFDPTAVALRDIAYHIDVATNFLTGFSYKTFKENLRTVDAVIRCLEIISEASGRLPPELKQRHSAIAWRNMAAAGNLYRHEYENVEEQQVWAAVRLALPDLKAVVVQELAALDQPR